MQTIQSPNTAPSRGPRRPGWSGVATAAAAVLSVPLLLLAILTKWGVLIAVSVAIVVGIAIWVWQKGFVFVQIVAFLIHFDGLGIGPIRMGRIIAVVASCLLLYKLVVERWRPPAIPLRHWGPVWMLVVWAALSGAWSDSAGGWLFQMGLFGLGIVFFCIAALLVDSHEQIQHFLRAYWIGGLFGSGAGILALFLGTRSVGFGGDPNFFGLLQASMIPLTVYYRRHATTARETYLYTFVLLFVLAGAAGAGSRSGLVGGALAIVGTMVTRPGLSPTRRSGVAVGSVFVAGFAFLVGFVANPNNLERGFADRGAGRLDLWTVSLDLIQRQPITGYGMGQLRTLIPANLLVTPGSQHLIDRRTEVSAHNTWLELAGDLGAVGLALFVTILIIAMVGFIRPRWVEAKELSTVLLVMMLPVLSAAMFLPLLNNKLAWALIGLSAALHVPSWSARWSGLPGTVDPGDRLPVPVRPDRGTLVESAVQDPSAPPVADGGAEAWESVRLARWDLRLSRRWVGAIVAGALVGAVLLGAVSMVQPTKYRASTGIFVPRMDGPESADDIAIDRTRMQGVLTAVVSRPYAAHLQELSGVELSISEVEERVFATRPRMGAHVEIEFTDTNRENVVAVMPHLITALQRAYLGAGAESEAQAADELRPIVPGEQRYYSGDLFLPVSPEAILEEQPPRTVWLVFIGMVTGALAAMGIALSRQRRPRVDHDDDFPAVTGLGVWSHVARSGSRFGATRDQYAQVLAMARDRAPEGTDPRRIVIASPRRDRAVRGLAVGLAGTLAASGDRVLLVDAQMDRPLLSLRLGGAGRAGLADVDDGRADLVETMRTVPRWRLTGAARRILAPDVDGLRFMSAGRRRSDADRVVPLEVFDALDPSVHVVVLAPPTGGDLANAAVLGWAEAVVLGLVVGRTVTYDAEDAAALVRNFGSGPAGVALLEV